MSPKWRALILLALAELLAMSVWFSATAVVPALSVEWHLTSGEAAWLTMAVQIGFVVGAVLSALLNVPDVYPPRRVAAFGAWAAAAMTAAIPLVGTGFAPVVVLRFLTGMAAAMIYPVGMKIIASWTREDRGLALGLMVGALTVGSASPHLVRGLGQVSDWHGVMFTAAGCAVVGGIIVWFAGALGPHGAPRARFEWHYMSRSFGVRSLRLANVGYLGHMWELYAMWTWLPAFLLVVYQGRPDAMGASPERAAALVTFCAIAVGGAGSLAAGVLADRWGRTKVTIASMVTSGTCALLIGLCLDRPLLATAIALVWGFSIVADSAQFSTAVSELGEPEYMGTLLTTQTAAGFLLTLASIRLIPPMVEVVGWRWAFALLAAGPLCGSWAMWSLRRSPEASRMAGGRR